MKEKIIIIGILASAFFAFTAAAEIHYTNEYWISTNATGYMYSSGGKPHKPLDGSTKENFDANMSNLPPYCIIHILRGTYQTEGALRWGVKSGQKIVGSGMNQTTLQVATGTPNTTVICSLGLLTASVAVISNVIISDLTCDCNYSSGNYAYNGMVLCGMENVVRRVKVKNESYVPGTDSEAWGISLSPGSLPSSKGNIIEDCEVDPLLLGHCITAIGLMGGGSDYISGIMRNNRVFLTPDPNGAQLAFNTAWATDSQIEDNYVDGADSGFCSDTGGSTNVVFAGNVFKNIYVGFCFWNAVRLNLTFENNNIFLCPTNNYFSAGFGFPDKTSKTNIVIHGNKVEFDGPQSRFAYFLCVSNITGLMVYHNRVFSNLDNYISASGLTLTNNYSLTGRRLTNLDNY